MYAMAWSVPLKDVVFLIYTFDAFSYAFCRHLTCQEWKVSPSNALIIPEGWWHQVSSDPGTIAVNFWVQNPTV